MVTTRSTGSASDDMRTRWNTYLSEFGTTVTLRSNTITLDSQGRPTAESTTTSTIKADIQWVTKKDLAHINSGEVEVGDGMLYVKNDVTINIDDDEIEFDGVRWRVISQVEGEQVQGNVVYKAYIIRKDVQS